MAYINIPPAVHFSIFCLTWKSERVAEPLKTIELKKIGKQLVTLWIKFMVTFIDGVFFQLLHSAPFFDYCNNVSLFGLL